MKQFLTLLLAASSLAAVASNAQADPAPRRDALNLSATAQIEVPRDTISLAFSTSKDGADATAVQNALKLALDAALAEAKKIAKPGQVEVQTGNFSIYPRYKNGGNGIAGWQGTVELLVEGRDQLAISQLTGRINSMSIARVSFNLSREAREKHEAEVVAQAIARFKAKAGDYARQFGYGSYQIGEVSVNTQDAMPYAMAAAPRLKTAMAVQDEALPVEAGKATVSVNVTGVVVMTK
ncbi:SIMPL domain-containing protein [Paucibacter sp. APW11]|uniref:SIMPL domain-containing protein n=1 Tax=Roseateles aquae TaxID=3077235 RepID=A0ABU3P9G3_9BURK|nr:SIMPL domain-containing protein [Paucibacter sp. APW11]MDT8999213.1 SIMPL domain-containing protein [Paucibacter sp. APW11]